MKRVSQVLRIYDKQLWIKIEIFFHIYLDAIIEMMYNYIYNRKCAIYYNCFQWCIICNTDIEKKMIQLKIIYSYVTL